MNPFIGETPTDTLDNCRYVIGLLMDAHPNGGDSVPEQTIMGRQLIYHGLMDAMKHAAGCLDDQADAQRQTETKP